MQCKSIKAKKPVDQWAAITEPLERDIHELSCVRDHLEELIGRDKVMNQYNRAYGQWRSIMVGASGQVGQKVGPPPVKPNAQAHPEYFALKDECDDVRAKIKKLTSELGEAYRAKHKGENALMWKLRDGGK